MIHQVEGITAAQFRVDPNLLPDARTLDGTLSFANTPPAMYLPPDPAAIEASGPPYERSATLMRTDQLHAYLRPLVIMSPLSREQLAAESGISTGTISTIFGERKGPHPKVAKDNTPQAPPSVKFTVAFGLHHVLSAKTLGFSLVVPAAESGNSDLSLLPVDVESYPRALGQYFREVRVRRHLDLEPVARKAGTSRGALSDFERGAVGVPHPNTVDRYYSGLDILTRFVIS